LQFTEKEAASFVEENKPQINRLRKTITNLMTIKHVLSFYEQLEEQKLDLGGELPEDSILMIEALTTSIVMSYGRLFSESKGAPVLKKKVIPEDFLDTHQEIIFFRNERYAHHGNHATTAPEIELFVSEHDVEMTLHWRSSMYNGAPPHWKELFVWVDTFLKVSFKKQMQHLSDTSGKEWLPFEPDLDFRNASLNETGDLKIGPLLKK
jgi:hypothetical protein